MWRFVRGILSTDAVRPAAPAAPTAPVTAASASARGPSVDPVARVRLSPDAVPIGLTPPGLAAMLRAADFGMPDQYLQLATMMEERYPHYAAVVGTRRRQVSQLPITVTPASNNAADRLAADLVSEAVRDIADDVFDLLDGLSKGYAVSEIIWQRDGRYWQPILRHWDPRHFTVDEMTTSASQERQMRRLHNGQQLELEPDKWVVHLPRVRSGTALRAGLARSACWIYLFGQFGLRDWVSFIEGYGQPVRLGRYQPGATEADIQTLLEAVTNIGGDAAAVIPASMQVEFITAKEAGQGGVHLPLLDYLDKAVSKLVLGQTGTTEIEGGSLAAARVHDGVRADIERADARQIVRTLRRDLVLPMTRVNVAGATPPLLSMGRPDEIDIDAARANAKLLYDLGVPLSVAQLREVTGLVAPTSEEDTLVTRPAAPEPEPAPAPRSRTTKETAAAAAASGRHPIDRAVDALDDADWVDLSSPVIAPILAAAFQSGSFEELERRLPELLAAMDTSELAERLAGLMAETRMRELKHEG